MYVNLIDYPVTKQLDYVWIVLYSGKKSVCTSAFVRDFRVSFHRKILALECVPGQHQSTLL